MKIVKCDRCGTDISNQFSAVGGFTTKRKLAIMLIPEELQIPEPNANAIVDLCETCDNQIYNEIFVNRNESAPKKSDNVDAEMKEAMEWHDLTDNPCDTPNRGFWFACKIKGSDNLKLVFGFENVNADRFDAWAEIKCPF
jgi:hypothetical protein